MVRSIKAIKKNYLWYCWLQTRGWELSMIIFIGSSLCFYITDFNICFNHDLYLTAFVKRVCLTLRTYFSAVCVTGHWKYFHIFRIVYFCSLSHEEWIVSEERTVAAHTQVFTIKSQLLLDFECWISHCRVISKTKQKCKLLTWIIVFFW